MANVGQVLIDVGDGTLIPVVPAAPTPPSIGNPTPVPSPPPAATTPSESSVATSSAPPPPPPDLSSDVYTTPGVNVPTGQFGQNVTIRTVPATTQAPPAAAPGPTGPTVATPNPPSTAATASATQPTAASDLTPVFDTDVYVPPGTHVPAGRYGQNVTVTAVRPFSPTPPTEPPPGAAPPTAPNLPDFDTDVVELGGHIPAGRYGQNVAITVEKPLASWPGGTGRSLASSDFELPTPSLGSTFSAETASKLPKWMLAGEPPPHRMRVTGKLPKALTAAENPSWKSPAGRERFAFNFLRKALDLSAIGAAALVGNMAIESRLRGKELTPGIWQENTSKSTHVPQTGASGFGIAQWTYPARKIALWNFAGKLRGTFAAELAFVVHELKNPIQAVSGTRVALIQPRTLDVLRNAATIAEATAVVMAVYEHPKTYLQVPPFHSVVDLLNDWPNQGIPSGANPRDPSGYGVRRAAAQRIFDAYG